MPGRLRAPPSARDARAADAEGGERRGRRWALTQRPRPSGVQNRSLGPGRVREEGECPPLAAAVASRSVTPSVCPVHVVAAASSARTPGARPEPPGAAAAPRGDGRRPRPVLPPPSSPSVRPSVSPPARSRFRPSVRPDLGPSPRSARFVSPRPLSLCLCPALPQPLLRSPHSGPLDAFLSSLRASFPELQSSGPPPPRAPHIFGCFFFRTTSTPPGLPCGLPAHPLGAFLHLHPRSLGSCLLLALIPSGFFLFLVSPLYTGISEIPWGLSLETLPPKTPRLQHPSLPSLGLSPVTDSPCSLSGLCSPPHTFIWVGIPCFALPASLCPICLLALTIQCLLC